MFQIRINILNWIELNLDSSNDKAYLENLVPAVVHRGPPLLEGPNGVTTGTGDRQHKTRGQWLKRESGIPGSPRES